MNIVFGRKSEKTYIFHHVEVKKQLNVQTTNPRIRSRVLPNMNLTYCIEDNVLDYMSTVFFPRYIKTTNGDKISFLLLFFL
jgi:hypothetical protein